MSAPTGPHVFAFRDAKSKLTEANSCISLMEMELKVSMPPRFIGNENEFIKRLLAYQMGKYNRKLGCVPVDYRKIKRVGTEGMICGEDPNIFFTIIVEYIVFNPVPGSKLVARVNKTSTSHVGMLVHQCFNASIVRNDEMMVVGDPSIGDEVLIEVKKVSTAARVMSLEAKLIQILTKCVIDFTAKKGKHKSLETDSETEISTSCAAVIPKTKASSVKSVTRPLNGSKEFNLEQQSDKATLKSKRKKRTLDHNTNDYSTTSDTSIVDPGNAYVETTISKHRSSKVKSNYETHESGYTSVGDEMSPPLAEPHGDDSNKTLEDTPVVESKKERRKRLKAEAAALQDLHGDVNKSQHDALSSFSKSSKRKPSLDTQDDEGCRPSKKKKHRSVE